MNSERQTRQEQIDLQLGRAGWAAGSRRLVEEFLVTTASVLCEPQDVYDTKNEFVDYALLDHLGRPIAIVEAKRSSRDPLEGERQAADYADALREKHTAQDVQIILPTPTKQPDSDYMVLARKLWIVIAQGRWRP